VTHNSGYSLSTSVVGPSDGQVSSSGRLSYRTRKSPGQWAVEVEVRQGLPDSVVDVCGQGYFSRGTERSFGSRLSGPWSCASASSMV